MDSGAEISETLVIGPYISGPIMSFEAISVLDSKIDTVYYKSRYWSCLLRTKLFQSGSQSCLVRLILLSHGFGLKCKKLDSQISAVENKFIQQTQIAS